MDELRYGLVGARPTRIGATHMHAIRRVAGARLAALCNADPDDLAGAAEIAGHPVSCYGDCAEMLDSQDLDAVVIATPNWTHEEISRQAFGAGVHVLCEKPLAATVDSAEAILAAARRAGRVLQVGFQRRYSPIYQRLHALLTAGDLGDPVLMWSQAFRGDWADRTVIDGDMGRVNWRHQQRLSGGSLLEECCHDIDICNWLARSTPRRVTAVGGGAVFADRDTIDHANVLIEYDSGCTATVQLSLFSPHASGSAGLIGTRGSAHIDKRKRVLLQQFRDHPDQAVYTDNRSGTGHAEAVYLEHVAFAHAIRSGEPPLADGQAGLAAVAVAAAAEESLRTGNAVQLRTSPDH